MAFDEPLTFDLDLAGQRWEIQVSRTDLETVHYPLLQKLIARARSQGGRYLVFLAGPPGVGKTAIAALWETLAQQMETHPPLQALPMDGFHRPNEVLDTMTGMVKGETVCLRELKGVPESFDLEALASALQALRAGEAIAWPRYDRLLHDPVPGALTPLAEGVLVIEGHFLLLDEPGWRELHPLADYKIFLEAQEEMLRAGQLARHQRGGRSLESALRHYERVDRPNWKRIMERRCPVDMVLRLEEGRRVVPVV